MGFVQVQAMEAWSASANGCRVAIGVTPVTTVASVTAMTVGSSTAGGGGVAVGAATGGDKGAGTLNATAAYANGTLLTSDARLKRDIRPLAIDALGLVTAIEPKSFKHNPPALPEPIFDAAGELMPPPAMPPAEWFERTWWGFLAEEVDQAIAGAGHQWDGMATDIEGNQSLSYNDLIAVLWRAVQQLSSEVTALRGN